MEESIFKKIATFQYSAQAVIIKGRLECEGIKVFMHDNNMVDSNPLYSNAIGGVKLVVKNEDFDKANTILSEISQYSLDENNELLKCPQCNAAQIKMVTSIKNFKSLFTFVFSLFFLLLPFYSRNKYKCNKCQLEF